jgi:threonylcarbamoyladenosine tRNA methylthiotransferase MtaB
MDEEDSSRRMKFSVKNLGCKVNDYEAESIARQLEERGYERVPFEEPADASLIFTCAVTNTAAAKSRQMAHRARKLNPDCVIVAAGCYAQIAGDKLPDAELVIGSAHKKEIPDALDEYFRDGMHIVRVDNLEHASFDEMPIDRFEHQTRAYLKVQDGCNQFCSYCVIPYARGRERSMDPDHVILEAKRIAKRHHEIVLAGIHTGRYGREYHMTLADLIRRILREVPELSRLRISSIEVTELDDPFLDLLEENPRIARHLHIPLQSGSDTVLKRMNRPYDTAFYYAKIEEIRRRIPDISISCDLMTGFPGETDEEAEETMQFLKKCRFSFLHVFPFSAREGTKAAAMKDQVPMEVRRKRAAACIALSEQLYDSYKASWIGKDAEILFEEHTETETQGHTSEYLPVSVEGLHPRGELCTITIAELRDHQLCGVLKGREIR